MQWYRNGQTLESKQASSVTKGIDDKRVAQWVIGDRQFASLIDMRSGRDKS